VGKNGNESRPPSRDPHGWAWVGAENFPELFSESVRNFSHREFPGFKTREEALAPAISSARAR
jgi:hypothetical protein